MQRQKERAASAGPHAGSYDVGRCRSYCVRGPRGARRPLGSGNGARVPQIKASAVLTGILAGPAIEFALAGNNRLMLGPGWMDYRGGSRLACMLRHCEVILTTIAWFLQTTVGFAEEPEVHALGHDRKIVASGGVRRCGYALAMTATSIPFAAPNAPAQRAPPRVLKQDRIARARIRL